MTSHRSAKIIGSGSYAPPHIMTNDDFAAIVDTSDEWISTRTGIKQRHVAENDVATSDLALEASRRALDDAGIGPEELDLIILATITADHSLPATACIVQNKLGARPIGAFDISAACSGFIYALSVARGAMLGDSTRTVLVIGAETLTKITDYTDRASCVLFGDGAGAVVLRGSDEPDTGILYTTLYCDGAGADLMIVPAGGSRAPASHETIEKRMHYMKIHGREVFRFAVKKMQELITECMDACSLTISDVRMVVPHQVNVRIIDAAISKLGFPREKIAVNIDRYGNTSSASIPIAFDEARRGGKLAEGDNVIMVAFGGGLTWAGSVIRM
ncbi:MAG: beta-ketoacyl-ACP synthase III [Planctomycetia bacterium]|nr:beta-ketoacyl-ACP synthase III [Planctomycetia bacterium]